MNKEEKEELGGKKTNKEVTRGVWRLKEEYGG